MRTLADLPTHPAAGLTDEAAIASRARFGSNRLTPLPRTPAWRQFLAKFDEPIIHVLLAAALLKIIIDLFSAPTHGPAAGGAALGLLAACLLLPVWLRRRGWVPALLFGLAVALVPVSVALGHPSFEGLAIMVAVALATGVAFVSEYRSDRAFDALKAGGDAATVTVVRGGTARSLPCDEVVVGDLIVLEAGDEVPADGRVVVAEGLEVDQSLMTGESEPVPKQAQPADDAAAGPEQPDCVYRGTQVVNGLGRVIACEVGDATLLGQLARSLSDDSAADEAGRDRARRKLSAAKQPTPLQEKLGHLARQISRVGYAAAAAIFLVLLVRGVLFVRPPAVFWPHDADELLRVSRALLDDLVYVVVVIVVAVPEGLPMSVTVSLALAMRRMAKVNALVRQLVACETVGSATVICTDKTGTLTENRMTVARVGLAGSTFAAGDRLPPGPAVERLILNAAVNSTARLESNDGRLAAVGNSTEAALLRWLDAGGWVRAGAIEYRALREQFPPLERQPFSSNRKRMATVVDDGGRRLTLVKGAPEELLPDCPRYRAPDGSGRAWTPEVRSAVEAQLRDAAAAAMRTLAFADGSDGDLVFAGFVALRDPLRPEVPAAAAECRRAGVEVVMVTGDGPDTARAVAAEAGLLDSPDALVLTGPEFNVLTDDDVSARLPRLRVLARARPADKLRLVALFQDRGEVVAVTGDGTNDAPALRRADVGLAMGRTGTAVAREASAIVLLDDSFATIVRAVHWGRALYENIQRFLQFQLTINVSALAIALLGPVLGVRPPFTVLQLLWVNVIMDTFAAAALCSEPPRPGLMRRPPKRRGEAILTPVLRRTIAVTAGFFVVAMLGLLAALRAGWCRGPGGPSVAFPELTARQVAVFFTTYVFFQVWNQVNCRSLVPEVSGLRGLHRNPTFLAVTAVTLVGQVLIVTWFGPAFAVEPLAPADWLAIAAGTSSVLAFAEVVRRLRRAGTMTPTGGRHVGQV
jgi:Ca2+-transporting ATPase